MRRHGQVCAPKRVIEHNVLPAQASFYGCRQYAEKTQPPVQRPQRDQLQALWAIRWVAALASSALLQIQPACTATVSARAVLCGLRCPVTHLTP